MPVVTIAFGGVRVVVEHDGERAAAVIDLLFGAPGALDETEGAGAEPHVRLQLACAADGALALREGPSVLRSGSDGAAADALLSRVCFHLADRSREGLVLHAGAVAIGGAALVVPGASGAGKTTLTAWLLSRGALYMSDEVVFVRHPPAFEALPRALHVKTGARQALEALAALPLRPADEIEVPDGALVSPARFGAGATAGPMTAGAIVFPRFDAAAPTCSRRLTAAEAGYRLVEVVANARNLPGHGFAQAVALARDLPAWSLDHSGFDGLESALTPVFDALAAASK